MDQSPQWQPIDRLAMVAAALTGELVEAERMRRLLEEARPRPHVLDDATVARVRHSYTGIQDDLWLYAEQLQRWERGALTADQRQALEQLAGQLGRLRAAVAGILALIDELAEGTIERMLGMSDGEAGLAWLRRQGQRKAACRNQGEDGPGRVGRGRVVLRAVVPAGVAALSQPRAPGAARQASICSSA